MHLHVGLPDVSDRAEILRIHLRATALEPGVALDDIAPALASASDGFSGADVAFVCQTAKLNALERQSPLDDCSEIALTRDDLELALGQVQKQHAENNHTLSPADEIARTTPTRGASDDTLRHALVVATLMLKRRASARAPAGRCRADGADAGVGT